MEEDDDECVSHHGRSVISFFLYLLNSSYVGVFLVL
jgi:hypothetical protein